MGISLSNKPDHMVKSIRRIRFKCKIWCFSGCLFYYYDTLQPKQYIWVAQEKLDQWMNWKHQ